MKTSKNSDSQVAATTKAGHPDNLKLYERKVSPEALSDGIDAYFADCEAKGKKPTKPGLCNFLGITTTTWDNWKRDNGSKPTKNSGKGTGEDSEAACQYKKTYAYPIARAEQYMSDALEQRTDAAAIFLMKQACYNGYSDKGDGATNGGAMTINLTFGETHKNTARGWGK